MRRDAGPVDEDVDGPRGLRRCGGSRYRACVAHIETARDEVPGEALGQLALALGELVRGQIPDLDARAPLEHGGRNGVADPAGGAGHDEPAVVEIEERVGS